MSPGTLRRSNAVDALAEYLSALEWLLAEARWRAEEVRDWYTTAEEFGPFPWEAHTDE